MLLFSRAGEQGALGCKHWNDRSIRELPLGDDLEVLG